MSYVKKNPRLVFAVGFLVLFMSFASISGQENDGIFFENEEYDRIVREVVEELPPRERGVRGAWEEKTGIGRKEDVRKTDRKAKIDGERPSHDLDIPVIRNDEEDNDEKFRDIFRIPIVPRKSPSNDGPRGPSASPRRFEGLFDEADDRHIDRCAYFGQFGPMYRPLSPAFESAPRLRYAPPFRTTLPDLHIPWTALMAL